MYGRFDLFGKGRFCGTGLLGLDPGGRSYFGPWWSVSFWTLEVGFILDLSGRLHFGPWGSVSFWTLVVGCILGLGGRFHFGPLWSILFWDRKE